MPFRYSVVIRTLGNSGDKYRQLLDSISAQTVRPSEIIVVIPEGYHLDHRLGDESVIYAHKGMVSQRAAGIISAKGDCLLIVDDDISFPPEFVASMYADMQRRQLDCILAYGNGDKNTEYPGKVKKPMTRLKRLRGAFTGQYFYSKRTKSPFFDRIVPTGGHKTYINNPDGLCQTGAGGCCLVKCEVAKNAHLEDEIWMECGTITQYAAFDDTVFFYKMYLNGCKIAYCRTTDYKHLNSASGHADTNTIERKRHRLYSIARNRTVLWYRFIYAKRRNIITLIGGLYGIVNYLLYGIVANILPQNWPAVNALFAGYRDAISTIKLLRNEDYTGR